VNFGSTLYLPFEEVIYNDVRWSDFQRFMEYIHGNPIKFPDYVMEAARTETYVVAKQDLDGPWADILHKAVNNTYTGSADTLHLILTDLCCSGLITPGNWRFVEVP